MRLKGAGVAGSQDGMRVDEAALSPKAQRTRARIFEAALLLFGEKGYGGTTMRDVASEAGSSLGLAYRYYGSKAELALELYLMLARQLRERVETGLQNGKVADRFEKVMLIKLELMEPYRGPLGALLATALDPNSGAAALGEGAAEVRRTVGGVFREAVAGAKDSPRGRKAQELGTALYAIHLALLLYWFHDRSEGAEASRSLIRSVRDALRLVMPVLSLPPASRALSRIAGAMTAVGIEDRKGRSK